MSMYAFIRLRWHYTNLGSTQWGPQLFHVLMPGTTISGGVSRVMGVPLKMVGL